MSDTSIPIGQNPSIVYVNSSTGTHVFLIYNSAQGVEAMHCHQSACVDGVHHTLKCGAKLYASALLAIDDPNPSHCNRADLACIYYMVIGYGHGDSSTSYVSFIICYDYECNADNMEEVLIDTLIDSVSISVSNIFGYSISLTTYTSHEGIQYPMFTYSKYSAELKQFILNVILCTDVHCHTWIGKSEHSYASTPPYLTLGIQPGGHGSVGQSVVSIKQTWIEQHNYVSIMFVKNVNITNNQTTQQNVNVLAIATCALSSSSPFEHLAPCRPRLALQSTIINEQSLRINRVSMVEYNPNVHYPLDATVPLFMATYVINNKQLDELWLLYCFNLFCNSSSTMYYRVRQSKIIDAAVITFNRLPSIVFFENSSLLMVMSCQNGKVNWNCTDKTFNRVLIVVSKNTQYETASMQIAVTTDVNYPWIVFSRVMNDGGSGGAGKFDGIDLVECSTASCKMSSGLIALPVAINEDQFDVSLDVTVFVIMAWICTFITIIGIVIIYKCISPAPFMSRNIRNAYLNQVALESARIRPLFYWFFFSNLICSAMSVVPWFAYFDVSNTDLSLGSLVIVAPFVPVILTLLVLIALNIASLTPSLTTFLVFISFLYWLSTILLSYSFGFVWNLTSENCQISDLSGLKMVILTGHIATCCVAQYLLFWNIRCYQALRLASPEHLQDRTMYYAAQNDMDGLMSYKVFNSRNKTVDVLDNTQ